MNDTELDELLNAWKSPAPSASWRQKIRTRIETSLPAPPPRKVFRGWKLLAASAAALAVVVLLANKAALSQMISPPPYTVDSEVTIHPSESVACIDLGKLGLEWHRCVPYSRPQHTLMSSYNADGSEVLLSWSDPGRALEAWLWSAKLSVLSAVDTMHGVLAPSLDA